ncbi:ankyrin repeat and LEM domain-containing protein 2 isoform X2 [Pimephales promelas]|uniref:ankyrin repeat and LEM domain-containing protein 2 isoform X2 n=1 Tax=Pimephales promelas TaxID=90988 RepID=UPI001955858F|nr:ankyrin repeat and LEM domain-containing protein 2 isoform X2 [Pimephales promelas]
MEAVLKRLQTLTSDQLREQIISAGLRCGPVTATTRSIFEKKLARALLEGSDVAVVHSGSPDPVEEPISETENGEETNHDAQTPTESPSVYYGVCPQLDDPSVEDGLPLVYTEKTKALKAVMKLKGARFKVFVSREDAENFAKGVCDGGMSPHTPSPEKPGAGSVTEWLMNADPANMEKANEFRSPRTQDLTAKLRRAVERGDEDTFRELVWGNPRYLIGSGDNPTIVQEGCRYNVLHVAAKENQAGMARLVLETLEDPEFMRLMYPHDQELMLWQRIRYIVDLYLNTPDKASNETPLHFACKFGCPEVVDVLCSHPSVDKHCRNKYDLDPSSMICERKNRSKEVKQKIREYLEEISVPWCPGSPESCDRFYQPDRMTDSPKHPAKVIKAFVGPLNASKAQEFHRLWRTPPRDRAGYYHHILKSDSQRGAERVGRELAREMGHPWAEHWDFLQCFIDLSSRDGLQMLDEHLRSTEARLTPDPDEDPGSSRRFPVCDLMQEFEKVLLSADHMIRSDEADEGSSVSSEEYFTADEDDDDDRESSSDSGSSFKSTRSSADRDSVDRRRPDVYILGDSPSKLDCEVLLALSGVDIDPLALPSVARWRDRVTAHSASETQSWPSASPSRGGESRSPSVLTRVTVSPKLRRAGHFIHPGQFMFSPPSRAYTRL